MKIFNKKVYGLIQMASKIGQDYYPEIMGNMLIINAPMLFTGVWAIVKGFLDQRTRDKIKILGSKYQKDLGEMVHPDNLPDFFGGNCKCLEYGGCMKSMLGPWNDYEMVQPVGIKKKQQPEEEGTPALTEQLASTNLDENKNGGQEPVAQNEEEKTEKE